MSGYTQQPTDDGAVTVEKYTQLHQSHQRLLQDYGRMLERVTALEQSTVDANRTSILRGLVEKYGIDFDEEAKLTLHSQGGSMTDDEFTRHVAAIEKYAQPKQPENVYIPGGEAARTEDNGEREKYELALAKEVKKVHGELMRSGKVADYDECRRVAAERLKQTA